MNKVVAAAKVPEVTKLLNVLMHSEIISKKGCINILQNFVEGNDIPLRNFLETVNADTCQPIVNSLKELMKGEKND